MTLKCGLEVTQVIENGTIQKLGYGFLFTFHTNYGRIFSHFENIQHKERPDFETRVWGRSRSLKMAPFDRPYTRLSIDRPL